MYLQNLKFTKFYLRKTVVKGVNLKKGKIYVIFAKKRKQDMTHVNNNKNITKSP